MASNALTAALLQSQNADPTSALMITPQMQLAQSMLAQGTDTSPIRSPWQGLARLGQVIAGRKIEGDAYKSMAGMTGQSAQAAAATLPDGPLKTALQSDNPLIRMQALGVYSKSGLLQANELHTLGPDQQLVSPGAPKPVATSTVPMTHEGQLATDVSNNPNVTTANAAVKGAEAAAEAKGKSPYETVETRSGAVLPLTSIPGIGETAGNSTTTPSPPAPMVQPQMPGPPGQQQPPPIPDLVPTGPGSDMYRRVQADMHGTGSPQTSEFGGGVRALPGGKGIMAPSQDTFKPLIEDDNKEVLADREKAIAGQQDMATVTAIRDFMPKVKTGWSAETKLEGGRILQAAGVDPKEIQNFTSIDPSSGQVLQKKFVELSAAAARSMGAREPGSVISMFAKAYPNLGTTDGAINLQSNALYMDRLRQQKMATDKTNYFNDSVNSLQQTGGYRGLKGFNEQFAKTDDPNDYLRAAESMSDAGAKTPQWSQWGKITDPIAQHRIISLIPQGQQYLGPDNQTYVKN